MYIYTYKQTNIHTQTYLPSLPNAWLAARTFPRQLRPLFPPQIRDRRWRQEQTHEAMPRGGWNADMYVCMYVCMCVCVYICMYVCMYVCMYICMYAWLLFYCDLEVARTYAAKLCPTVAEMWTRMYVCICVCVCREDMTCCGCVCMYVYTCVYVMKPCPAVAEMLICMHVCMYMYVYVMKTWLALAEMLICMNVCMFVCMYVCMYVCVYVRLCHEATPHGGSNADMYVCVYVCMHVRISMYICMHVCLFFILFLILLFLDNFHSMCVYVYVYMYACMYVCMPFVFVFVILILTLMFLHTLIPAPLLVQCICRCPQFLFICVIAQGVSLSPYAMNDANRKRHRGINHVLILIPVVLFHACIYSIFRRQICTWLFCISVIPDEVHRPASWGGLLWSLTALLKTSRSMCRPWSHLAAASLAKKLLPPHAIPCHVQVAWRVIHLA